MAKKQPEPPAEPEQRTCPSCGAPYDQLEADSYIPVCVKCQRDQDWSPTGRQAKLTR